MRSSVRSTCSKPSRKGEFTSDRRVMPTFSLYKREAVEARLRHPRPDGNHRPALPANVATSRKSFKGTAGLEPDLGLRQRAWRAPGGGRAGESINRRRCVSGFV